MAWWRESELKYDAWFAVGIRLACNHHHWATYNKMNCTNPQTNKQLP